MREPLHSGASDQHRLHVFLSVPNKPETIISAVGVKQEEFVVQMKTMRFVLVAVLSIALGISNAQTYTLNEQWVSCGNSCKLLDPYYSDGVTFEWTGGCVNGKAHGVGKALKYKNGVLESTYEGEYKNGIREGRGKFTHASDNSVKEGIFVNGQLTGKGTMTDDNGNSYIGNFINYRLHGNGKYKMANGGTMKGYFVADRLYTGTYVDHKGQIVYIQEEKPVEAIKEQRNNYKPQIGSRVTEYFDKEWNRCQAKDAAYYRIVTYEAPNKPKGIIKDFYITGEKQGDFYAVYIDYDDEGKNFFEGVANWYYKSGKLEKKCYYLNSKVNGPELYYYEDGTIKSSATYEDGILNGTMVENYPNGSPRIIANYEDGNLKNNKSIQIAENGAHFLIYNENFLKNSESWEYTGANGQLIINSDNSISLHVNPSRTVSGGIYTGFSPNGDNVISVLVHRKPKDENIVGLLFGFKDWDNYCGLYISGSDYTFQCIKNGMQMTRLEWKTSAAIESETNMLSVINMGNKMSLAINNVTIEEFSRVKYEGGYCCVTAINKGSDECQFDAADLTISELVDPDDIPSEYMPKQTTKGGWTASGSGFLISETGYVATNYHVIDEAKVIEVSIVRNGEWEHHPAKVVLSDKQNDLSILKIDDPHFSPLPIIPYNFSTKIKDTGSEVFTLGYPIADVMGDEVKFTDGKISSKTGIQGDVTVYQISVPIQPGNSGGPLFDSDGNLVGITSSGLNRDYFKSENVNYAIKSSYLKALVDAMPQPISLQDKADIADKPLTEKIKLFQSYMTYIKVK